jgi:hypothetical protein
MYSFLSKHGNRILCASFKGTHHAGDLRTTSDVAKVRDMTLTQIRDLNAKGQLRSGLANVRPIEDYLRRGTFSLDEIFHFVG